jgi:hypothetical protein
MGMGIASGLGWSGGVDELHRLVAEQEMLKSQQADREAQKARLGLTERELQLRTRQIDALERDRKDDNARMDRAEAETRRHNTAVEGTTRAKFDADEATKAALIAGAQRIMADPSASAQDKAIAQAIVAYGPKVPAWVIKQHPAFQTPEDRMSFAEKEKIRADERIRVSKATRVPKGPSSLILHGADAASEKGKKATKNLFVDVAGLLDDDEDEE